jgi:hypothetical protein
MRQTRGEMNRELAQAAEYLRPPHNQWTLRSRTDTTDFIRAIETGDARLSCGLSLARNRKDRRKI